MSGVDENVTAEVELVDPAIFQGLANLEKEFGKVELDALRRKEFAVRDLYTKRNVLCSQIPNFWPQSLMNGPQEFQSVIGDKSVEPLMALKGLNIERYQIKSETEGEPRSLRFTFEFDENDWFEDKKVVKEFEFVVSNEESGSGDLVSKPVSFKWKNKGKMQNKGVLDLTLDLYKAEEAVRLKDGKSGKDLEAVDREDLWQYQKLMLKLEMAQDDEEPEPSWLDWFGYRGPVGKKSEQKGEKSNGKAEGDDEDMDSDDEDDGMLDVEVFPMGEEVAIALAEDLWPNVMDYFMAAEEEPLDDFDGLDSDDHEDDDGIEEGIPELIEAGIDNRPSKRQRTG